MKKKSRFIDKNELQSNKQPDDIEQPDDGSPLENERTMKKTYNKKTVHSNHLYHTNDFKSILKNIPKQEKVITDIKNQIKLLDPIQDCNEIKTLGRELSEKTSYLYNTKNLDDELDYYLKSGKFIMAYYDNSSSKFCGYDSTQKKQIFEEYMSQIDPHYLGPTIRDTNNDEYCFECECYRESQQNDSLLVCPICHEEIQCIVYPDKVNNNDQNIDCPNFAYKRINHFRERLLKFKQKSESKVPTEAINIIKNRLEGDNLQANSLTENLTKGYLINTKYKKHISEWKHIKNILNGLLDISVKLEEQMYNKFTQIQPVYEKFKPAGRSSFMSYPYVMHKICLILEKYELATIFPLLKAKDKLHKLDKIWKNICGDMNWIYHPS